MAGRAWWWGVVGIAYLLLASRALATEDSPAQAVNAAIGDVSWVVAHGEEPGPDADDRDRIRVHLDYVETRLRAADVGHLHDRQRAARLRALDVLARYRRAGDFPRRTADPYAGRRPRFIDDRGVRCAVGEMIAGTGHAELAEAIDREHEYDAIGAIRTPGLRTWMEAHGFIEAELAMVQPAYTPVPSADSVVDSLERSAPAATLECARRFDPRRRVTVVARGDREGNVEFSTVSRNAFARCFADSFGTVRGGGAYDRPVRRFRVRRRIQLETPQAILERQLGQLEFGGTGLCALRPGPIPNEVKIDVSVGEAGLEVTAATSPANATVEACLVEGVSFRLAAFGPGRWRLAASVTQPFERRLSDSMLQRRLRVDLRSAATACWDHDAPESVSAKVDAVPEPGRFDIELTGGNDDFRACAREQLDRLLRDAMRISMSRPDGTIESFFRIDAAATATVEVDVESPAKRDERIERELSEPW